MIPFHRKPSIFFKLGTITIWQRNNFSTAGNLLQKNEIWKMEAENDKDEEILISFHFPNALFVVKDTKEETR